MEALLNTWGLLPEMVQWFVGLSLAMAVGALVVFLRITSVKRLAKQVKDDDTITFI